MSAPTIVVFCHLRWDFVFQRPQQLLTRLADSFNILMVEEPVYHEGSDFLQQRQVHPGVTVCTPHTGVTAAGFHDDQLPRVQALLRGLLPGGEQPIVWFYTPMAVPLLSALRPSLVVYDCMDELSAFKNPPPQLMQREAALLARADIVFTGGPSLFEAKRLRHRNVWCFPSSVDAAHFGKARAQGRDHPDHPDQLGLPHPRLGFYGVIDERFDMALLETVAAARPAWQLVMVGPVVKIDPGELPRRPNIHYMGQRDYQDLPWFLSGWDVCLMPFAINESTRFISPTKVLEYMAAERPIVSTPVKDVAIPYGKLVAIAADAEAFIAACEAALALAPSQRKVMTAGMREIVESTSWQRTAEQMGNLLKESLHDAVMCEAAPLRAVVQAIAGQPRRAHADQCANEASFPVRQAVERVHADAKAGDGSADTARLPRRDGVAVASALRTHEAALQKVAAVARGAAPAGRSDLGDSHLAARQARSKGRT